MTSLHVARARQMQMVDFAISLACVAKLQHNMMLQQPLMSVLS